MAGTDPDGAAGASGGFTVEGDWNTKVFHLLQLKYALILEIKGLRHSQGSAYAYVKKRFGFKGNKQRVLDQLVALIESKHNERTAQG